MTGIMKIVALVLGLVGIVLVFALPPVGILALIVGALLFMASTGMERRALEAKRHQEILAATRQAATPAPADQKPSIGDRLGKL